MPALAPKKLHLPLNRRCQPFKILRVPVILAQNCWRGQFGRAAGMPASLAPKKLHLPLNILPPNRQHFKIAQVAVVLAQNCWRGQFGRAAGVPASLPPKKLHLALNILPQDVASTFKFHGCQSYLLKTVGGANLEGLLGRQLRWHPKYFNWH